MDYLSALLLGLSSGIACISICLPGMVPILLGQSSSVAQSAKFVTVFLSGRWLAYLLAAVLSSILSAAVYGIVSAAAHLLKQHLNIDVAYAARGNGNSAIVCGE